VEVQARFLTLQPDLFMPLELPSAKPLFSTEALSKDETVRKRRPE